MWSRISLILSMLFIVCSFSCDAKISSKQEEKFVLRSEDTFKKLLIARDRDTDKMIEYVLRFKKDIDKTYKVTVVIGDFFDYACDKIKAMGFELTYEQKRYFRHELKVKKTEGLLLKVRTTPEFSQLVYGVSLIICGQMFQNSRAPNTEMGKAIEEIGLIECKSHFDSINKSL